MSFSLGMIFFQLIMRSSHMNSFKGKWLSRMKEPHEELESINLTLIAQQGYEAKSVSDSPCLTYLERSNTKARGKAPMFPDATNTSDEENPAVTEELLR